MGRIWENSSEMLLVNMHTKFCYNLDTFQYSININHISSKFGTNFSMDTFVQRFQPERYSYWLNGDDFPAEIPSIQDVLINKNNKNIPQSVLDSLLNKNNKHPRFKRSKNLPFSSQFPDINISEILTRSDVPEEVKRQYQFKV